jgi:hypothetical protein
LLVLELAAAVAASDFHPGETDEVTTARVLAHACDLLVQHLNDYCRHVLARLARERSEWPF